ncbi:unnamed protein product [Linum tenue]|uniref:Classical arabinogalactan protein 25 n=1 Tax=Linum tenue TaxID=586396 RepID=A0AAV0S1L2_9ROSI|nr:unnamed protein product [Linum tenue]
MISATILFFPSLTTSQPSTIIPASPALLENSPPLSPYEELSPDIAPLLPTPGGELPSPSVASIPTIPSNPSTPNPDEFAAAQGPAAAALGSLPVSSAFSNNSPYLALSVLCSAIFSIQLLKTWSS